MLPEIACGSTPGQLKIHSPSEDSLAAFFDKHRPIFISSVIDTIGIPKRIVYQKESGVFLNEFQEQITLEKLLWKEQYRQDAVSMYWVNQALEERVNDVIAKNIKLERDLKAAETQAIYATTNMEHYRKLFTESEASNKTLRDNNQSLKFKVVVFKTTTIVIGTAALYQAYLLFFKI
jgi:hypothetical protein